MAYLDSTNIKVFPAVRRSGTADPFSRLMSESTITSIINRLVDYEGFVITRSSEDNKSITSGVFEFNVFGYYVKIADVASLLSNFSSANNNDVIYAYVEIDTFNTAPGQTYNLSYEQLVGQDDNNLYKGVTFQIGEPSSDDIHYLPILKKEGAIWVVPETSYLKFNKDTLALYDIDGGEI